MALLNVRFQATKFGMKLIVEPFPMNAPASAILLKFRGLLNLEYGPWIAGGAPSRLMRGEEFRRGDIDIFCRDEEMRASIGKRLPNGTKPIDLDERAFSLDGKIIQVIPARFFANDVTALFRSFDFTVCQFATDGYDVVYTPEAKADSDSDTLRMIDGGLPSRIPIYRLLKYAARGFNPVPGLIEQSLRLDTATVQTDFTVMHDIY